MKSLEIVNDLIWKTQRKYDYVDLKKDKNQIEKELEEINSEFSKLNQIKQDLEVLEIFKKLWFCKTNFKEKKEYFIQIHLGTPHYNKLKQWLEDQ